MRMSTSKLSVRVGIALLVTALLTALSIAPISSEGARATSTAGILNGDFEMYAGGDTVTGWALQPQRTQLGVDNIAGCLTADRTDYLALFRSSGLLETNPRPRNLGPQDPRIGGTVWMPVLDTNGNEIILDGYLLEWVFDGYRSFYGFYSPSTAAVRYMGGLTDADNAFLNAHSTWDLRVDPLVAVAQSGDTLPATSEQYSTSPTNFGQGRHGGRAMTLSTYAESATPGFTIHGSAMHSDEFYASAGQRVSIEWNQSSLGGQSLFDAYIVNTSDCSRTNLAHSLTNSDGIQWNFGQAQIPANAYYQVILVAGGFDASAQGFVDTSVVVDNVLLGDANSQTSGTTQSFTLNVGSHVVSPCVPGTSSIQVRAMPDLVPDSTGFVFSNVNLRNSDNLLGGADWQFAMDSCGTRAQGYVQATLSDFVDSAGTVATVTSAVMSNSFTANGIETSEQGDLSLGGLTLGSDVDGFTSSGTDLAVTFDASTPSGTYTGTVTYSLILQ
jgi:hypothetical protein